MCQVKVGESGPDGLGRSLTEPQEQSRLSDHAERASVRRANG